jgi:hypothetical protein
MVNFKKIISYMGFLTAVVFVPLLLATCGSAGDKGDTGATGPPGPGAVAKYLYLFSDAGTENLLLKIDTSANSQVSSTIIGFHPGWPANNPSSGSTLWGVDSDGTDTRLYGVNISDGSSALKPSFAAVIQKMFADTSKFLAPEIASANPETPALACETGSGKSYAPAATWTGTAPTAGGSTWTAVTSDGTKVWVANRGTDILTEGGYYEMYDAATGALMLSLNAETGVTTDGPKGTGTPVGTDFVTLYDSGAPAAWGGRGRTSWSVDGPCDMSVSTVGGTEYMSGVGINGDTLTTFNASTGQMVSQMPYIPIGPAQVAQGYVAPFMNSNGVTADGTPIITTENSGTESIVDFTDPTAPVERIRFFSDFMWNDDGDDGTTPEVAWDPTGLGYVDVTATYATLLTGAVTTTIYQWTAHTAGYPEFVMDIGGNSRGTTSEIAPNGNFAYLLGNPITVIDLTGSAPWVATKSIDATTWGGQSQGSFTPDSKKFFPQSNIDGVLGVIDTSTHTVTDLIAVTGKPRNGGIL